MGAEGLAARAAKHMDGATVCGEKILASNTGVCVEDRYETAIHLGNGKCYWNGWLNVDLYSNVSDLQCDLRKLELPSNHADALAAIHVLEHFYEWEAEPLLSEWRRVLKPGGKMILELPCMDKVFGYAIKCAQGNELMQMFMTLFAMYGDPKHKSVAMTHKWGYFTKPLTELLARVGMREIQVVTARYHFPFRDMRVECVK